MRAAPSQPLSGSSEPWRARPADAADGTAKVGGALLGDGCRGAPAARSAAGEASGLVAPAASPMPDEGTMAVASRPWNRSGSRRFGGTTARAASRRLAGAGDAAAAAAPSCRAGSPSPSSRARLRLEFAMPSRSTKRSTHWQENICNSKNSSRKQSAQRMLGLRQ